MSPPWKGGGLIACAGSNPVLSARKILDKSKSSIILQGMGGLKDAI
jgi:hypothetical protein